MIQSIKWEFVKYLKRFTCHTSEWRFPLCSHCCSQVWSMDLPSGLMWPTQDPGTEHANSTLLHVSFKGLVCLWSTEGKGQNFSCNVVFRLLWKLLKSAWIWILKRCRDAIWCSLFQCISTGQWCGFLRLLVSLWLAGVRSGVCFRRRCSPK